MIKALGFTGMVFVLVISVKSAVICVPGDAATIQAGIDLAVDGDTVRIGSGIWRGDGNRDIDVQGKQIVIESEAGPESCILDIEGTEDDLHTGFIFTSNEPAETILSGVTITNGSGYNWEGWNGGGALFIKDASPTVNNCTFSNNCVDRLAGAVHCDTCETRFFHCDFFNNYARSAGTVWIRGDSSVVFESCRFSGNHTALQGGGILLYAGSLSVSNCLFMNNMARNSGGAIKASDPGLIRSVWIQGSIFYGNSATDYAGAVYSDNSVISDCVFIGNSSGLRGGAVIADTYDNLSVISNCIFKSNQSYYGGAVYFSCSDYAIFSQIHNCLFESNHSYDGGAVFVYSSSNDINTQIHQSTFCSNSASHSGGGLFIDFQDVPVDVVNCIFQDNFPSQIEPSSGDPNAIPNVIFSNIQGGWRGYGCIDEDPLFCSDGLDRFFLSQIASGQSRDSPCLDKGSTDASLACIPESTPPVCMDAFTTRTDRATDSGTVDMGFHYPPDWTDRIVTGVRLWMPDTHFHPGDTCACKVFVYNLDTQPLTDHVLFVVLDIMGVYYFAPSFKEYDSYQGDYPSFPIGRTEISVIPEFIWPTGAGSFSGAVFCAAPLDPTLTRIVGMWDWFQFGWGE